MAINQYPRVVPAAPDSILNGRTVVAWEWDAGDSQARPIYAPYILTNEIVAIQAAPPGWMVNNVPVLAWRMNSDGSVNVITSVDVDDPNIGIGVYRDPQGRFWAIGKGSTVGPFATFEEAHRDQEVDEAELVHCRKSKELLDKIASLKQMLAEAPATAYLTRFNLESRLRNMVGELDLELDAYVPRYNEQDWQALQEARDLLDELAKITP